MFLYIIGVLRKFIHNCKVIWDIWMKPAIKCKILLFVLLETISKTKKTSGKYMGGKEREHSQVEKLLNVQRQRI